MSSLQPLDAQVEKAELHYRQCKRCQQAFEYCHSREPGRLYCFDCAPIAKQERKQRARRKYRRSEEGQKQHCDEESERRERLRDVGDRRCMPQATRIDTRATTAAYETAVEEFGDGARNDFEWVLVAWPEVLAAAKQLLGSQIMCRCCGRLGRVSEVLELAEWRRRREETS